MGRPVKNKLDYFPLDVDFFDNHKLLMIEEDFGIKGGYLAVRLMAMVYSEGYYLQWKDRYEHSCAKRVGNGFTGALVYEVLKCCLKHGLFDRKMFEEHQVLTSRGIQERWTWIMNAMRRKVEILPKLSLISSEETTVSDTFSTQKEKKENKIKENTVAAEEPPPPEKNVSVSKKKKGKSDETPEPFWKELVEEWFDFNVKKFGEKPSFERNDPKIFKRIIIRLRKRAEAKQVEWTAKSSVERLGQFLSKAFEDKWLSEHFLLSNLENQFDTIILNHKINGTHKQNFNNGNRGVTSGKSAGAEQLLSNLQNELTSYQHTGG